MAFGLITGLARAMRRKRSSSLDILTSKKGPRDYYKGKNCKSTGFHTRKGGYVLMKEKLPHYVVPDLTGFKEFEPGTLSWPCPVSTTRSQPEGPTIKTLRGTYRVDQSCRQCQCQI